MLNLTYHPSTLQSAQLSTHYSTHNQVPNSPIPAWSPSLRIGLRHGRYAITVTLIFCTPGRHHSRTL